MWIKIDGQQQQFYDLDGLVMFGYKLGHFFWHVWLRTRKTVYVKGI